MAGRAKAERVAVVEKVSRKLMTAVVAAGAAMEVLGVPAAIVAGILVFAAVAGVAVEVVVKAAGAGQAAVGLEEGNTPPGAGEVSAAPNRGRAMGATAGSAVAWVMAMWNGRDRWRSATGIGRGHRRTWYSLGRASGDTGIKKV